MDDERERELRRALASGLPASGTLRTPRWTKAFESVPRHVFVPVIFTGDGDRYKQVNGTAPGQRSRWLELVYRDEPLVTQLGERRAAEVPPSVLGEDAFGVFAALRMQGVQRIGMLPDGESEQTWLVASDGSWACHADGTVRQGGPQRLWGHLEAVHRDWDNAGRPACRELGLTVTADGGHRLWHGSENEPGWMT